MKTRNLINNEVVWFGSAGKTEGIKIPADSFSFDVNAVAQSIYQRLSVIKSEIWWNAQYGLPLFEKVSDKTQYDMVVMEIVTSTLGVNDIEEFTSEIVERTYSCKMKVNTIYGQIEIQI